MNSEMNTSMQSRRLGGDGTNGSPESELSNFECYQNYKGKFLLNEIKVSL